ncbi:hypothetical protein [Vibrio alginolyticus]|uniref:hypothetical protein n=1 Tax=Vibrio alginolyticus TaxID=663 RepID=UPI00211A8710|nr:hypothetical protein [Vibrio alginolyticus]MCQ9091016.1 hypothetical protein [Vibrio alginolyticus]
MGQLCCGTEPTLMDFVEAGSDMAACVYFGWFMYCRQFNDADPKEASITLTLIFQYLIAGLSMWRLYPILLFAVDTTKMIMNNP